MSMNRRTILQVLGGTAIGAGVGSAALRPSGAAALTSRDNLGPKKVWVLQQVSSKAELLKTYRAQIANCRATVPAVGGFGLRIAWSSYVADKTILDAGKMVADENGLEFSFRFMAGRWTPASVLTAMGSSCYATKSSGERFPKPFNSAGSGGNPVFESAYEALLREVATWYDANDVHLLHNSWYAMDWAELNHGIEVRSAAGYSQAAWLTGHQRLIDIWRRVQVDHPNVVMEGPLSGYGPLTALSPKLADHMVAQFGASQRNVVLQANGWGANGQWGAPSATIDQQMDACFSRPLGRAVQAIQPWGGASQYGQYTVQQVQQAIAQAEACASDYMEIYAPTLRSVNGGAVWATPLANWVAA
ncbi:MAG: hypothetical protein JWO11_3441 [Nocardioides sp.]|nr:hypothetical protein [Nocardioides sp.]